MNFGGTVRLSRAGWLLAFFFGVIIFFMYFSRFLAPDNDENRNLVDLKELLIGAIEASKLGGKKVIAGTKGELHVKSKGKTLEGANDPVTDADFASHCEMYHSLAKAFPSVHIRSEEDSPDGGICPESSVLMLVYPSEFPSIAPLPSAYVDPKDVTVWIDPLDATKEYTDKMHQFVTTMVCVAVKGVPVIGVIHQPFTKHTSWAWLSTLMSTDILMPPKADPSKLIPHILVSMSHKGKVESLAKEAFGAHYSLSSAAGAGFKVLEVVHGNADIYLHDTHIKKWDVCAGNAIINSIGGRMTTLKNETLTYSFDSDVVNKDGLLVAVQNHNYYIGKVNSLSFRPEDA